MRSKEHLGPLKNFIELSHVYFRPLRKEDADGPYPHWLNDPEVCRGNGHATFPYTLTEARQYIESVTGSRRDIVFAICRKSNHQHIGNVALLGIDWVARTGEFAILIGDKSMWGKGVGYEALKAIIEYAFYTLNLERVYWGTIDGNKGMISISEQLGAIQEGRRIKAVFKGGQRKDMLEFGILREDYKKRSKSGKSPKDSVKKRRKK